VLRPVRIIIIIIIIIIILIFLFIISFVMLPITLYGE